LFKGNEWEGCGVMVLSEEDATPLFTNRLGKTAKNFYAG
jgi:hypothetical protein